MIAIFLSLFLHSYLSQAQFTKLKWRNAAFQAGFEYVKEMWFSPDGRFAYTASGGGMGHYEYDPTTGKLDLIALHNMEEHGYNYAGVSNFVFSNDGMFAYTIVENQKDVHLWKRDQETGRLTFLGQLDGVIDAPGFQSPLCISPDDNFIYIGTRAVINIYKRNKSDGSLSLVKREWANVSQSDIYITKDGKLMYLAGDYTRIFSRDTSTGLITFKSEELGTGSIGLTGKMVWTSDEKFVFCGNRGNGLARFSRDAITGNLSFLGFYSFPFNENYKGPAEVNGLKINTANDRLYVSSYNNLTSYSIDSDGKLQLIGKVDTHSGFNEPYYGLGLSHDNKYVYGFGSATLNTSIECFKANSDGTIASQRIHYFNESLDRGLGNISAEVVSKNGQFVYVAAQGEQLITAFRSGINANGEMSELNRVSFSSLGITTDYVFDKIVVTSDNKYLYATTMKYSSVVDGLLFIFDISTDGSLHYRDKFNLSTRVCDLELSPDDQHLYISTYDKKLRTLLVDSSGGLSEVSVLSDTEMGYDWGPEDIVVSPDGKFMYLISERDENSSLNVFILSRDSNTGQLELVSNKVIGGGPKHQVKIFLSEKRNKAYVVFTYSFAVYTYLWESTSGRFWRSDSTVC